MFLSFSLFFPSPLFIDSQLKISNNIIRDNERGLRGRVFSPSAASQCKSTTRRESFGDEHRMTKDYAEADCIHSKRGGDQITAAILGKQY